MSRITFALATLALASTAIASSASLDLTESRWVGKTELQPGHYKIEVQGNTAIFKKGKETTEVAVTVESGGTRYADTTVESSGSRIQKIHLGGSNVTISIKAAP